MTTMNGTATSSICMHRSPPNIVTSGRADMVITLSEYFYIICLLQENIWKEATVFLFSLLQKHTFRVIIIGDKCRFEYMPPVIESLSILFDMIFFSKEEIYNL